jgi:(S)-2-hydroxyglutarate dehydrogenase
VQGRFPGALVTVVDKEDGVARHQTGNNSGVLHCGLAYRPGTAKARLAVRGIAQMVAFCEEHGVAHEVCGKLVVAAREEQVGRLEALR